MSQKQNNEIIQYIQQIVDKYPEMRFGQILANMNIIEYERNTYDEELQIKDPWNDSSLAILKRIRNSCFKKILKKL